MVVDPAGAVNREQVKQLLERNQAKMKYYLSHCAHCALCAESCFLYQAHDRDPQYMPAYKVIHSVGELYRKKDKVDRALLLRIKRIVWKNCALCQRCYCPMGVSVPSMIAFARMVCRSQGVYPQGDAEGEPESWL